VLNKDVLTQAEVLIALRMTGPRDVAAIDEWVRLHAEEDQAVEVKRSLPSLPIGTAWVWSPGWLGLLQRVAVRPRATFDSSATPKAGQRRVAPTRLAPIDLAALGERITAMATEAAATDPAQLRRRVAQLERELTALRNAPPQLQRVEVPVLDPTTADRLENWVSDIRQLCGTLGAAVTQVSEQLAAARTAASPPSRTVPAPPRPARQAPERPNPTTASASKPVTAKTHPGPDRAPRGDSDASPPLKAGARRMLHTLARHHPMRVTRAQLATLSRFKVTGGTFNTYYSTLRRAGLITEQQGLIELTDDGRGAAGVSTAAPASTAELLEQWRTALKAGARTMLDLLIEAYPDALTREELAQRAGYEVTGGHLQHLPVHPAPQRPGRGRRGHRPRRRRPVPRHLTALIEQERTPHPSPTTCWAALATEHLTVETSRRLPFQGVGKGGSVGVDGIQSDTGVNAPVRPLFG